MSLNFIRSGHGNIHIILDGVSYLIPTDHKNYDIINSAVEDGDIETLREPAILSIAVAMQPIADFGGVDMSIESGELLYRGQPYHRQLGEEILKQIEKGYDPAPLLRFLEKCENNPNRGSVDQLFSWMGNVGLAMADDGDLLGFKYVTYCNPESCDEKLRELAKRGIKYTDDYSKKFNYNVGETPAMPRQKVQYDPSQGCSWGLHVGTLSYVKGHDHILLVKVNPADVVSVPTDCSHQKLRACRFYIIQEFDPKSELFDDNGFSEPVVNSNGNSIQPSEFKRQSALDYKTAAPANDNEPDGYGEFVDNPSATHWSQ